MATTKRLTISLYPDNALKCYISDRGETITIAKPPFTKQPNGNSLISEKVEYLSKVEMTLSTLKNRYNRFANFAYCFSRNNITSAKFVLIDSGVPYIDEYRYEYRRRYNELMDEYMRNYRCDCWAAKNEHRESLKQLDNEFLPIFNKIEAVVNKEKEYLKGISFIFTSGSLFIPAQNYDYNLFLMYYEIERNKQLIKLLEESMKVDRVYLYFQEKFAPNANRTSRYTEIKEASEPEPPRELTPEPEPPRELTPEPVQPTPPEEPVQPTPASEPEPEPVRPTPPEEPLENTPVGQPTENDIQINNHPLTITITIDRHLKI
jgi:hypothetical protein